MYLFTFPRNTTSRNILLETDYHIASAWCYQRLLKSTKNYYVLLGGVPKLPLQLSFGSSNMALQSYFDFRITEVISIYKVIKVLCTRASFAKLNYIPSTFGFNIHVLKVSVNAPTTVMPLAYFRKYEYIASLHIKESLKLLPRWTTLKLFSCDTSYTFITQLPDAKFTY